MLDRYVVTGYYLVMVIEITTPRPGGTGHPDRSNIMQTLYIYSTETNEVVARIHGNSNQACEAKAYELGYLGNDDFGATYSPAFGANDGLIDSDAATDYDA